MESEILKDERTILAIVNGSGTHALRVGKGGVTAIIAYGEPGQYCNLPWVKVMRGDEIFTRISATHVAIEYAAPTTTKDEDNG